MFHAKIEAWANGPIIPQIYRLHRQDYYVREWPREIKPLSIRMSNRTRGIEQVRR